jgi:hypothetical protein
LLLGRLLILGYGTNDRGADSQTQSTSQNGNLEITRPLH